MHNRSWSHRPISVLAILAVIASITMATGVSQAVNVPQSVIVNPNPANFTPNVLNGQVNAIIQIGTKIYAGGQFTQVQASTGGTVFTRSNLFSFDATTGAIDTGFAPTFDNIVKTLAIAPDGNLFVGGYFNSVNGDTSVHKLVKLNPTTGQRIAAFSVGNPNGQVWDIRVWGNLLIVGGRFTLIKNVARDRLAAVDSTTGNVSANVSFSITDPHTSDSTPWIYSMDREPGRLEARDHRQLHEGQRAGPSAGGPDRPLDADGESRQLGDRSVHPPMLLERVRHVHARRRLLARWLVLRDRRDRRAEHRDAL